MIFAPEGLAGISRTFLVTFCCGGTGLGGDGKSRLNSGEGIGVGGLSIDFGCGFEVGFDLVFVTGTGVKTDCKPFDCRVGEDLVAICFGSSEVKFGVDGVIDLAMDLMSFGLTGVIFGGGTGFEVERTTGNGGTAFSSGSTRVISIGSVSSILTAGCHQWVIPAITPRWRTIEPPKLAAKIGLNCWFAMDLYFVPRFDGGIS
jgi:hypothetical protein